MYLARKGTLTLVTILMVLAVCASASTETRPFSPVQEGFTTEAFQVLPYVEGSLLVKFTPQAMGKSQLDVPFRKGAVVANQVSGLKSVDALVRNAGTTLMERPFIQPSGTTKWVSNAHLFS